MGIRRFIYDGFFITLLVAVLYGVGTLLAPFFGPLLAALICAVTVEPAHRWMRRFHPPGRESVAAFLTVLLVLIFFIGPILLLMWSVVAETADLAAVVKQGTATVDQLRQGNVLQTPWMNDVRFFVSHVFGITRAQFQQHIVEGVDAALLYVSHTGTLVAGHIILLAIDLLLLLFALFFLVRDGERMYAYFEDLIPMRQHNKSRITKCLRDTLIGIARGLVLAALVQGVIATIGYLIVGASGAVMLGGLTALSGFVPVLGTLSIWGSVSLFYFLTGAYLKGIFVFAWGILLVAGFVDTVLRPYLIGRKMDLPMFMLFFALLGGLAAWGAKGFILGPVIFALAPVLLDIYKTRYLRQTVVASTADDHSSTKSRS